MVREDGPSQPAADRMEEDVVTFELPDEIWGIVLKTLPVRMKLTAGAVNRTWRRVCVQPDAFSDISLRIVADNYLASRDRDENLISAVDPGALTVRIKALTTCLKSGIWAHVRRLRLNIFVSSPPLVTSILDRILLKVGANLDALEYPSGEFVPDEWDPSTLSSIDALHTIGARCTALRRLQARVAHAAELSVIGGTPCGRSVRELHVTFPEKLVFGPRDSRLQLLEAAAYNCPSLVRLTNVADGRGVEYLRADSTSELRLIANFLPGSERRLLAPRLEVVAPKESDAAWRVALAQSLDAGAGKEELAIDCRAFGSLAWAADESLLRSLARARPSALAVRLGSHVRDGTALPAALRACGAGLESLTVEGRRSLPRQARGPADGAIDAAVLAVVADAQATPQLRTVRLDGPPRSSGARVPLLRAAVEIAAARPALALYLGGERVTPSTPVKAPVEPPAPKGPHVALLPATAGRLGHPGRATSPTPAED